MARFNALDLFSGAGGFSLGLERAGFRVGLGVDSWPIAAKTYAANFNHPIWCTDLSDACGSDLLDGAGMRQGQLDLVVGGPPCQGFSIQRIGTDQDARNSLVTVYARLIRELGPRLFILENVPGLLGTRGRPLLDAFLLIVREAGFETSVHVVNAADYGVPQQRKRVIVLGWRVHDTAAFELPQPAAESAQRRTVMQAIGDMPAAALPGEVGSDPLHKQSRLSALNQERLKHIPPGGGMEDLPVYLRATCHKAGASKIGHRYVYGRLAPDRPASTITARFDSFTRGRFAHPFENRNITLREGARLQTFPDSFEFVGNQEEIAAQIGNAVPPLLAEALVAGARAALERSSRGSGVIRRAPFPPVGVGA